MYVIGITGGVGSGKSTVLAYLKEAYHVQTVQADLVAKALQEKGQQVFLSIVEAFGRSILDQQGSLDRNALADIVFGDEAKLKLLNNIVHPAVKKRLEKDMELADKAGCPLFFLEAALLLEAGYDDLCDEVWFIDAGEQARTRRLQDSRGYSPEKIREMFASQLGRQEFLDRCQVVIENSGSMADTFRQIDRQMKRLKGIAETTETSGFSDEKKTESTKE